MLDFRPVIIKLLGVTNLFVALIKGVNISPGKGTLQNNLRALRKYKFPNPIKIF